MAVLTSSGVREARVEGPAIPASLQLSLKLQREVTDRLRAITKRTAPPRLDDGEEPGGELLVKGVTGSSPTTMQLADELERGWSTIQGMIVALEEVL